MLAVSIIFIIQQPTLAVDYRALYEKVSAATAVIEIRFTQHSSWSEEYRERG